ALDVPDSFERVRRLLRPGGLFAFVDMLWTEAAPADAAASIHAATLEQFGIAMVPRAALTWRTWEDALRLAGLSLVAEQRLQAAESAWDRVTRRAAVAIGLARRPRLLGSYLAYRSAMRAFRVPQHWFESR